jgi:hypothetical protein
MSLDALISGVNDFFDGKPTGDLVKQAEVFSSTIPYYLKENFKKTFLEELGYAVPDITFCSLSNVVDLMIYFKEELGLDKNEQQEIVKKNPSIISLSVVDDGSESNVRSKIKYYDSELGITPKEFGVLVKKFPHILGFSVVDDGSESNVRSKIDFYTNDYGLDIDELRDLIISTPVLLSRAIKSNIEPKVYYLRLKNKVDDYKITTIFVMSDSKFSDMCRESLDEYKQFKDNWVYLTSQKQLNLDKYKVDIKELVKFTKDELEQAYKKIELAGKKQDLTNDPNLIFSFV